MRIAANTTEEKKAKIRSIIKMRIRLIALHMDQLYILLMDNNDFLEEEGMDEEILAGYPFPFSLDDMAHDVKKWNNSI